MDEPIVLRRKRLIYRSRYRGCREADLLIGAFAARYLPGFDAAALDRFEALIDEADQDLLAWVLGREMVPPRHRNDVFDLLRRFDLAADSA